MRMTRGMTFSIPSQSSSLAIDRWMRTADAAEYLSTSANNIRNLIYRGFIKPSKFQGRWIFRQSELDRLLQKKETIYGN